MAKKTKSIKDIIASPIKEINDGITIEKLNPQYFNMEKLLRQPEPIYRLDMADNRMYYRFENKIPVFYTSVTTMIKKTLPTSPHLITWLVQKGGEGKDEANERACYGTFLHQEIGSMLINGKYSLDTLPDRLMPFLKKEGQPESKIAWTNDLKKDILCFAQFAIERDFEPLAIEVILYHPTGGYAGAIDIVGNLTWNKKRITAIIDIKSGKKGFYSSHIIQLGAYWEMWKIHFPDTPIERVFNWGPKDFRGVTPTYNFKDQTDEKDITKLPYLVELGKIEADKWNDKTIIISGDIDLTKGIDKNIQERSLIDLICENK